jgi:hypothetical protein
MLIASPNATSPGVLENAYVGLADGLVVGPDEGVAVGGGIGPTITAAP